MDLAGKLNKGINFGLLTEISSNLSAQWLVHKFERYYGKKPSEDDFYKVYLGYCRCLEKNSKMFCGSFINRSAKKQLISYPKLLLRQVYAVEQYLFKRGIIEDKIFYK